MEGITTLLFAPVESEEKIKFALSYIRKFDVNPVIYSSVDVGGDWIPAPEKTWKETQKEQACDLFKFLREGDTHLLHCECDGIPFRVENWDAEFLKYDYIGAPWGPKGGKWPSQAIFTGHRVGNGGFSLRSRGLLEECKRYAHYYISGTPSDQWVCSHILMRMVLSRFKFADIDTAIKFSFECPIPEHPNWDREKSFGLHGRNFHPDIFI
jgi:hypothetical protein